MKITATILMAAMLGGFANAAGFVDCDTLMTDITNTPNGLNRGYDYCRVYMGITPKTVTSTFSSVRATRTVTTAGYNYQTIKVTPDASTSTQTIKSTAVQTAPAGTRTQTVTITSTAYLMNDGETYAIAKRDAEVTGVPHLEARARPGTIPVYMTGFNSRERQAACRCINTPRTTVTRSVTKGVYATVTKNIGRNIVRTTTLPVQIVPAQATVVLTKVISPPAEVIEVPVVEFDQVRGCPPSEETLFLCPDGTGVNDESDPNFQTCSVNGLDGFSGNCVYWSDDGSPVESTLTMGDGSGDPNNDQLRQATYGDGDEDDCPTWADWTCQPDAPIKRSLFTRARKVKVPNHGTSRANHGKTHRLPQRKPVRGGGFITYAQYIQQRLEAQAARAAALAQQ